jgi:CubicO group peptidase (beta-lactamase class C family)
MWRVEARSPLHIAVGTALDWPVPHVAAAVVLADGTVAAQSGEQDRVFHLASVTKLLAAYAVLIAVEEGAVDWDDAAGPEGSTMRHLVAHTSGLSFSEGKAQAKPGARRIYSNSGFEVLDEAVAAAAGMSFADYLDEAVLIPLGMESTSLEGSAAADAMSTCADLTRFAAELQAPTLVSPGLRPAEAERLGAGLRDPRRQVAALDGREQLPADIRPLRAVGHVPVGGPGRRSGVHRPDGP